MGFRNTRRRARRIDPLASVAGVRSVLGRLRSSLPSGGIPPEDNELRSLLRSVRYLSRYQATDTRRGRPARWSREYLLRIESRLSDLLSRETSRETFRPITVASFVDHYLQVLEFPPDVVAALEKGEINLFEASHLSRIKP